MYSSFTFFLRTEFSTYSRRADLIVNCPTQSYIWNAEESQHLIDPKVTNSEIGMRYRKIHTDILEDISVKLLICFPSH